jgi:hypothetical protein
MCNGSNGSKVVYNNLLEFLGILSANDNLKTESKIYIREGMLSAIFSRVEE